MSMNEDKIIKTTICCYIAVSIVASLFFFLSRHQFNELEFSQKNLSFYLAREGVRFYTPENIQYAILVRLWLFARRTKHFFVQFT